MATKTLNTRIAQYHLHNNHGKQTIYGYNKDDEHLGIDNGTIDISKVLKETYYNGLTGYEVDVKVMNVPFSELIIPDGKVYYEVVSPKDRYIPRDVKRVNVYVNGMLVKTLNLPVAIQAYKEVLVAKTDIVRDQAITEENTTLKRVDCTNVIEYVLDKESLKKEMTSKKIFRTGEVIDKRFINVKPDVVRNTEVRVFFASNDNLMITIDAVALEDGLIGEWVNVENKNYKKVYKGKIIGENRVLVTI